MSVASISRPGWLLVVLLLGTIALWVLVGLFVGGDGSSPGQAPQVEAFR